MDPRKRIVVNTIAQYTRSVINMGLALFTTRIVIGALGMSDYGIYTVVGGVVAMLGFVTNALVLTTQRYISYYHGRGDLNQVAHVVKNSLVLHLVIALLMSAVLLACKNLLIEHYLVLPPDRVATTHWVYLTTTLILFLTIMSAPLKALFIAHENIIYISVIEVCEYVLKLVLALWLMGLADMDHLLLYAGMMASVHMVNLLAYLLYALRYYQECQLRIGRKDLDGKCFRDLLGFAGWNTYSVAVGIVRQQGLALLFNRFLGTVINAAYGIAFQVFGAVGFVASSLLNAMNPQIMKAEGAGDRQRMLRLAELESKYMVILMVLLVVPMSMMMQEILEFWLGDVPPHAAMFCNFVLITSLLDDLTIGLNSAQQALGKLRTYTLWLYTPKLLVPVMAWLLLHEAMDLSWVMWVYLLLELLPALGRILFFRRQMPEVFSATGYLRRVICPVLLLAVMLVATSWGLRVLMLDVPAAFFWVVVLSALIGLAITWQWVIPAEERTEIVRMICRRKGRKEMGV